MATSGAEVERQAVETVREVKRTVEDPGGGQAGAALHRLRALRAASSTRPAPTGWSSSPAFTGPTSTSRSSRSSARCRCRIPRSCCCACAARRCSPDASRRRSRSPAASTPALDVIKATMAGAHATQMVSALLRHGPDHLRTVRRRDRGVDAGARVDVARRDARQHEPRAAFPIPRRTSARISGWRCDEDAMIAIALLVARRSSSAPVARRRAPAAGGCAASTPPSRFVAGEPQARRRAAGRLRRQRHLRHLPRRQGRLAQGHAARAGEESALAGGDPRLRELPRPRPGARRRRREGAHPEVRRR